jgi:hypothetical protein
MAVSLGFRVVFSTAVTLILVPTLCRILEDVHALFGVQDEEPEPLEASVEPAYAVARVSTERRD